jgi:hypothetical protein
VEFTRWQSRVLLEGGYTLGEASGEGRRCAVGEDVFDGLLRGGEA